MAPVILMFVIMNSYALIKETVRISFRLYCCRNSPEIFFALEVILLLKFSCLGTPKIIFSLSTNHSIDCVPFDTNTLCNCEIILCPFCRSQAQSVATLQAYSHWLLKVNVSEQGASSENFQAVIVSILDVLMLLFETQVI